MEVYIIRHTPVAVGKDTCYGQTNVPLSGTFLQDVERIKSQLPTEFDAVYCSPLQRCSELAAALSFKNNINEKALMEMNFGDWENTKWNDINAIELDRWMNDFVNESTPNGESLQALYERSKTFFDDLRSLSHHKVLLITHAGVIRCLWAYLLAIPLQNIFKIPVGYNEVFVINLTKNAITDAIKQTK